jgi:membrane protease YdiL (CAAX protease family)
MLTMKNISGKRLAMLFEGGLVVLASGLVVVLAWWPGWHLWHSIWPTWSAFPAAVLSGFLATVPLVGCYLLFAGMTWPPLVRLRRETVRVAHLLLGDASTWELAVVSALAGVGEEMLFRGVVQPVAVYLTTPLVGLIAASLLFGLAHCLTWLYFSFATLVGLYLGTLALLCGEIVTPAVVHGLYDFVVLVHVLKLGRRLHT